MGGESLWQPNCFAGGKLLCTACANHCMKDAKREKCPQKEAHLFNFEFSCQCGDGCKFTKMKEGENTTYSCKDMETSID